MPVQFSNDLSQIRLSSIALALGHRRCHLSFHVCEVRIKRLGPVFITVLKTFKKCVFVYESKEHPPFKNNEK